MREVLCNTSPLFYLHQLGLLDLLPALYARIAIPEAVSSELREGARLGHAVPVVDSLAWITIEKEHLRPTLDQLQALRFRIAPALRESVLRLVGESET